MNDVYIIAFTSAGIWLLRWSALLAIGWVAHLAFRRRHPKWRLIVWRTTLVGSLILPFASLWPTVALNIRMRAPHPFLVGNLAPVGSPLISQPVEAAPGSVQSESFSDLPSNRQQQSRTVQEHLPADTRWMKLLLAIWIIGGIIAARRLVGI